MAKRMLADVLWEAANVYLSPTPYYDRCGGPGPYSCWAIYMAMQGSFDMPDEFDAHVMDRSPAWEFIRSLAAGELIHTAMAPGDDDDCDIQGNRYMWLLLAMHVAEDEGITV